MSITSVRSRVLALALLPVLSIAIKAQSSDQAYPTAVTENVIHASIRARDVGDARLTSYYYTFNGEQGDLFLNIVTTNLSGSIDVFTADSLKPLTKVMVYADLSQSETGRVIYLRKPEKLILRVEGRTPNDDPAEFQIKFAGSFVAAVQNEKEPPVPKVSDLTPNDSGVRVNSVGTIVAVTPKPKPTPKAERSVAEKESETKAVKSVEETRPASEPKNEKSDVVSDRTEKAADAPKSSVVAETKTETEPPTNPATTAINRRNRTRPPVSKPAETKAASPAETPAAQDDDASSSSSTKRPPKVVITDNTAKPEPNPMANVRLVIMFKDGSKVERPMTEVERFTVDQRTLTVIGTNGRVARFSMLEVASVNIQ